MDTNDLIQLAQHKTTRGRIDRYKRLLPNDRPRYIRVYDNGGKSADRYTCVFTGRYCHKTGGDHLYLGMSSNPFDALGVGQHGFSSTLIDRPKYSHLGKPVSFDDLPEDVKTLIVHDYLYLWDFIEA